MYIDPHTQFRYPNDQKQARIAVTGTIIAAVILALWIIEIVKFSPSAG
jgi:hypothetical protein